MSACMPTTVRSACFSSSARICRSTSSLRRLFSRVLSSVASRSASRWSATSRSPARLAIASVRARSGACAVTTKKSAEAAKNAEVSKQRSRFLLGALGELGVRISEERFPIYIGRYRQPEVLQYGWRDIDDLQTTGGHGTIGNQHTGRLLVVVRTVVPGPLFHVGIDQPGR